ncbi:MAG: putative rane protein [Gemmatimonadetes bacterium]|nr:putative rane protein [Gemmatimonadota bacterium]
MPLLNSGAERCAVRPGTYTVGGNGPGALPMAALEWCAAVATIVVPPSGPSTIQRLAASVVVWVDRVPLGVAPRPLHDGARIEFEGRSLTFETDRGGEAMVTSASSGAEPGDRAASPEPSAPFTSTVHARILNVRTGEAIELGNYRVVVGRDAACDFLVAGMGVSRRHFSVSPVQGGYLLRDESANGTVVNGSRVSGTYLLGHGDVLRLDDEELRFEVDGVTSPAPSAAAAPTAILDMSRLRRELAAGGKRELPATPLAANLEIVRGPYAGASFSIDRPVCSIGRGPQSDVRVRDDSVSTNHATLLRKGGTWFVVDLCSANGTFVDGSRVAGERELAPGSRLKLGSVEMMFRSLNAGVDAPIEKKRKSSWLNELLRPFRRASPAADID